MKMIATTLATVVALGVCSVGLVHATFAAAGEVVEQEQLLRNEELFYVIANETSTSSPSNIQLPLWTPRLANPFQLSTHSSFQQHMTRKDWWNIPGTFQIFNVLTSHETKRIVDILDNLGYHTEAAVSVPHSIRHNQALTLILDDTTLDILWKRVAPWMYDRGNNGTASPPHFQGPNTMPMGLNGRFRVYKYQVGDHFKIHGDGSWPGSRVRNNNTHTNGTLLLTNAFEDEGWWSQYSLLISLNEKYQGGATEFWVDGFNYSQPAPTLSKGIAVPVRTPVGGVLVFPHGDHPLHCLHASTPITSGVKYIIRTDLLFGSPKGEETILSDADLSDTIEGDVRGLEL